MPRRGIVRLRSQLAKYADDEPIAQLPQISVAVWCEKAAEARSVLVESPK